MEVDRSVRTGSGTRVVRAPGGFRLDTARRSHPARPEADAGERILAATEGRPVEAVLITLADGGEPACPPEEGERHALLWKTAPPGRGGEGPSCGWVGSAVRKMGRVAVAAGVVLLVGGCGGDGAAGGSSSSGGSGVRLTAAQVDKEIGAAAGAAGFTKASFDTVSPKLKECMINWAADEPGGVADPEKSYADTLAGLVKAGWAEGETSRKGTTDVKILTKGDWTVRAGADLGEGIKMVAFAGVLETPECTELYAGELGKK
ncbi:hypothetical protein [Streptomyces roseolus]|uniref:hypothetical protein n=1 Tax=Streptomyces roseolus TaxID=67358 RepID=UPI003F4D282A